MRAHVDLLRAANAPGAVRHGFANVLHLAQAVCHIALVSRCMGPTFSLVALPPIAPQPSVMEGIRAVEPPMPPSVLAVLTRKRDAGTRVAK